jgi:hypothetical protein
MAQKRKYHLQGVTGVNQKANATEEMPLHFTNSRHRLHHLYTELDW